MPPLAPRWTARALALGLAALTLLPLGTLGWTWAQYVQTVGLPLAETPPRGYDGVRWSETDSVVVAEYVLPRSAAAEAGIVAGDSLRTIDYLRIASATDAERQIERATGTVLTYGLDGPGGAREVTVRIDRHPTFLFPLSGSLWQAAAWGFAVVALLHLLAYLTILPLAGRSGRARRARRLIGAALVWVGGNLARIVWVTAFGPPPSGGTLAGTAFDALTLVALAGWIAYPTLLLDQGLRISGVRRQLGAWRWVLVVPGAVLSVGVGLAVVLGRLGPLPPDGFAVPILFYVCVMVAAATGLVAADLRLPAAQGRRWSVVGSVAVGLLALVGAVLVLTRLGPGSREAEVVTAWFLVGFQLLSLLPVALVSSASLRHGPIDALLIRTVSTGAVLVAAFGAVVAGSAVLDAVLPGGSHPVALGAFVVVLLLLAERLAPALRDSTRRVFETERQRARRRLDRFGDRLRSLLDIDELAEQAAEAVGEALGVRSAVIFLQAGRDTPEERWVRATYRPEPPSFTQAELGRVWERIREEGHVWSRNEELNEAALPAGTAARLSKLGAALAVPVTTGRGVPVGLIALGRKARRLSVYTTEDVAQLRALAAQLALAVERLRLVDRERALVRQTSEAEMAALRAQINPHFLFNALNTVAALIRDRPDQAEATVEHLAALFRDVLNASGQALVPLRDEIRLVRRYLFVEEARFGEALEVEVAVEPAVEDVLIPAFAVQTLVENAVKHGIERKRGGGRVTVHARRAATDAAPEAIDVRVSDTGAGLPPGGATFGVGLSNVADRIDLLYDGRASLVVGPLPDAGGTLARLLLPLTPA